ncbi:RidA family protein [Kordiimonas sp.]|uniref:RidA family protein n=1 Tax=Kordiimonas sp. TaxID=1970157 RepID=UPI003B528FA6
MKKFICGLARVFWVSVAMAFGTGAMAEGARDRAETIVPEGWQNAYDSLHYAPAVKIDGVVYLSGVVAGPAGGDLKEGYRRAWRTIGEILKQSGASLDDIVEITTFHTNLQRDIVEFGSVKDEFIRKPYPTWTAIGTTELYEPTAVVEIKVVAHLPK